MDQPAVLTLVTLTVTDPCPYFHNNQLGIFETDTF